MSLAGVTLWLSFLRLIIALTLCGTRDHFQPCGILVQSSRHIRNIGGCITETGGRFNEISSIFVVLLFVYCFNID